MTGKRSQEPTPYQPMRRFDPSNFPEDCKARFEAMTDDQLISAFNREVGNTGWGSARAAYLGLLHEEFDARGFDYSVIGDRSRLSFARRVELIDKRIEIARD